MDINDETPILTFSVDKNGITYSVNTENTLTVKNNGNDIIWVTDNKGNVTYIINVSKSTYKVNGADKVIDNLDALWTAIDEEKPAVTPADTAAALLLKGVANWDNDDLAAAEAAVVKLAKGTTAEKALAAQLQTDIDTYKSTVGKHATVDALIAANAA